MVKYKLKYGCVNTHLCLGSLLEVESGGKDALDDLSSWRDVWNKIENVYVNGFI